MERNTVERLPTLYGLSKKGKVKEWSISVYDSNYPTIVTMHGYSDGKKQVDKKEIKVGKNIGRSNETSPWEQALSQAKSTWNKKKDNNYYEVLPKKEDMVRLPMLALEYSKRGHAIVFPCYAQPKLNGIRCTAVMGRYHTIRFFSRKGKEFTVLNHLPQHLVGVMEPGDIFDGELYNHDLTFQQITAAVKREKSTNPLTKSIQYHVYDMCDEDRDFDQRNEALYARIEDHDDNPIKRVSTKWIQDKEQLMEYHDWLTLRGYEGTMIRNLKGGYLFQHRSENLQKMKDFLDEEFDIIGGQGGQGRAENQCTFKCVTNDGKEFDVRCVGTDSDREEQLRNLPDYIGKKLSTKFQNYSDDGVPIFPVGLAVRDYE